MISNTFLFKQPCNATRVLITSVNYDQYMQMFELELLGVGSDGFNFTNSGKAWMDDDDLQELMNTREVEFPQQLCGMQLMFEVDEEKPDVSEIQKTDIKSELKKAFLEKLLAEVEEIKIDEGEDNYV